MKKFERFMKALANRRRMEIVKYLFSHKKCTVGILAEQIKLSFKSTSKHLGVLKSSDIVDGEQVGLSMFYSLSEPVHPITKLIISNS
jgi:DNA-binding transcriptional ArsR family regulator